MAFDQHHSNLNSHMQNYYYNTDDDEEVVNDSDIDEDDDEYEEVEREETKTKANNNNFVFNKRCSSTFSLGRVLLDPRGKWVEEWNRVFLLVCAMGLFVDPVFLYTLSINDTCMCLFVDGWLLVTVTVIRCMTDALHLWNIWLQFYIDKRFSFGFIHNTPMRRRRNTSHALRYFKANKGFFFDIFILLPLPQIVLWVTIPSLLEKGSITRMMTVLLIMFVFQYLPKIYHSVCIVRRNLSGYIFGTVWWGFALNMIAYFIASHAAGACWYLLGLQRAAKCLEEQCGTTMGCGLRTLCCKEPIYYGSNSMVKKLERTRLVWAQNTEARSTCLTSADNYEYGVYEWSVQLVTNNSRLEKILLPIFWGLMTLRYDFRILVQCIHNLMQSSIR